MHDGGLGFGGINPCGQSHGDRKFYEKDQNPMQILLNGNYSKVPIFSGAVYNDGLLIVAQTHDYFLKPDNLHHDEYFLEYKILEKMTQTFGMDLGYAFKTEIQNAYFWPSEMGNFNSMLRGLKDVIMKCNFFSRLLNILKIELNFSLAWWHGIIESTIL